MMRQADQIDYQLQANYVSNTVTSILNTHVHPLLGSFIKKTAKRHCISKSLLAATILIESNRRPLCFRTLENMVLRFSLLLFRIAGCPLLDLSVGICQIKVSSACRLSGLPHTTSNGLVYLPNEKGQRKRIAHFAESLTRDIVSVDLAAKYIANCMTAYLNEKQAPNSLGVSCSDDFLQYLAEKYNGSSYHEEGSWEELISYFSVLRMVVESLEARCPDEGTIP